MLTKSQQKVLQFIQLYSDKYDCVPTIAEIAKGIGIKSRGVVHRYLQALITAGFIKTIPNKHRNIQLINSKSGYLPLVGKIAAGQPIAAIENIQWFNIADKLIGEDRYLLKVIGDSMIEECICDGDIAICRKTNTAQNGEVVVALIDNHEATLKRIQYSKDNITLIPANAALQPITYRSDRIQIQGVLIGLLRLG